MPLGNIQQLPFRKIQEVIHIRTFIKSAFLNIGAYPDQLPLNKFLGYNPRMVLQVGSRTNT